jgi:hypothetical protein
LEILIIQFFNVKKKRREEYREKKREEKKKRQKNVWDNVFLALISFSHVSLNCLKWTISFGINLELLLELLFKINPATKQNTQDRYCCYNKLPHYVVKFSTKLKKKTKQKTTNLCRKEKKIVCDLGMMMIVEYEHRACLAYRLSSSCLSFTHPKPMMLRYDNHHHNN